MWTFKNYKKLNLKKELYCVDLHTDKILFYLFVHCLMADWARQKHLNGISFKENLEVFTHPVGIVNVKCNM